VMYSGVKQYVCGACGGRVGRIILEALIPRLASLQPDVIYAAGTDTSAPTICS